MGPRSQERRLTRSILLLSDVHLRTSGDRAIASLLPEARPVLDPDTEPAQLSSAIKGHNQFLLDEFMSLCVPIGWTLYPESKIGSLKPLRPRPQGPSMLSVSLYQTYQFSREFPVSKTHNSGLIDPAAVTKRPCCTCPPFLALPYQKNKNAFVPARLRCRECNFPRQLS